MMKRLFIFLAIFMEAVCYAESNTKANTIVFEMKDGSCISYLFEEMPKIRFTAEEIIVTTQQYETIYQQNSVLRYQFVYKELSSISAPPVEDARIVGDVLSLSNLTVGASVYVYSVDGKQLMSGRADAEGKVALSLTSFPVGVYLVKYAKKTVKIRKS